MITVSAMTVTANKPATVTWQIETEDGTHTVSYRLARLRGRMYVTVDSDEFELPAGLFGLGAARREMFRIGDEGAELVVTRGGKASVLYRGREVPPTNRS
jgi:hypothetical protein